MQSMWLCILTCITGGSLKRTRRQFEKDPAAVLKGPGGSFKRTAAVLKGPGGSFKRTRRQFQKDPAAVLKGLGYIFSKHVFVFFGQIWPLWTMKPTSNILPRCNKNSEQHSYICGTIPLNTCLGPENMKASLGSVASVYSWRSLVRLYKVKTA